MGAVRLQHREFGVVGCVRTLVAEVSAQLVHRAATANHQAFEVQLGGDAQRQILAVGVDVGTEGACARPAVHRVQDGGLNLEEAFGVQARAQCFDNRRA